MSNTVPPVILQPTQSSDLLGSLIDANPAPIGIYDLETHHFLHANHAFAEQYEFPPERVSAVHLEEIYAPEELPRLRLTMHQSQPPGQHSGEWQHRLPDGNLLAVEVTCHLVTVDGRPGAMLTIQNQPTSGKPPLFTERHLWPSQGASNLHTHLLDCVSEAVIATDLDGKIVFWNLAAQAMYGWSPQEAIGQNVLDLIVSEPTKEQAYQIMAALARGENWRGEFIVRNRNGNAFPAQVNDMPILDRNGKVVGLVGVSSNTSERQQLLHQLTESEQFARTTLDALNAHIAVVNPKGEIIAVNRSWRNFADTNPPAPLNYGVGTNYLDLCDQAVGPGSATAKEIAAGIRAVLAGEQDDFRLEYPCHSPTERRHFAAHITKFPGESDNLVISHENVSVLRHAQEIVQLLFSLSQAIESAPDFESALQSAIDIICRHMGWSYAEAWLPNDKKSALTLVSPPHARVEDAENLKPLAEGFQFAKNEGLPGRVWATGKPVWIPDVSKDPSFVRRKFASKLQHRTAIGIPVLVEGKVVAVMVFFMQDTWEEDPQSALFLSTVTAQLGVAFHRKSAEDALHGQVVKLNALYALSTGLRSVQESRTAVTTLLDNALAAFDTAAGAVWLYRAEWGHMLPVVSRGWFDDLDQLPMKPGEGVGGHVFASGISHVMKNIHTDPMVSAHAKTQIPEGWGGACVPIRLGETIMGVVYVSIPLPRQFNPDQVRLLESMSSIVGETLHRIQLWQEAHQQAEQIKGIMNTAPTGMVLLDSEGTILLTNPVADQALSFLVSSGANDSPDKYQFERITHLGDQPLANLLVSMPTKEWQTVECASRIFDIIANPMQPEAIVSNEKMGDAKQYWVLAINDITSERKRQQYQHAQERLASIGQLAAGIAHDFNNIMSVITLYVGNLQRSAQLTDRQTKQLETINNQAIQASSLIRQILDFSRRSLLAMAPVDMLPLLVETVVLLERTLPRKITVTLESAGDNFTINGDPSRIQQVLLNLAINARDAMANGGKLTFKLTTFTLQPNQEPPLPDLPPGSWVCLHVTDTGTGISDEDLAHIFEPFFTTKETGKGTGLGLAQVYGIITQHNGFVLAESLKGAGTTFSIYLPQIEAVIQAKSSTSLPQAPEVNVATILLVEDNPVLRQAVAEILEEQGHKVLIASNGAEALQHLGQPNHVIDLIISDVMMPGMDGAELLVHLRKDYPQIRTIFMSGYTSEAANFVVPFDNNTTFIQKPFDLSDLLTQVNELLALS